MENRYLFRAKRCDTGEWVVGNYQRRFDLLGNEEHYIFCSKSHNDWEYVEVDPSTICQCTGLKDKNGQKIFDGDILEAHLDDSFPEDVTRVSVTFENMKWCLVQKGMIPDPFEKGEWKYWEVIGNIFDNPELIGETKDGESR